MRIFQTKTVDKIKTHVLYPIAFFPLKKSCRLLDKVENTATARQAREGNIIGRMRIEYCTTKATFTHSEYAILIYCFSTATVFAKLRLNFTLYVRRMSALLQIKEDNQNIT